MRSMPGGIIRAADEVVQGDVEVVRQSDENIECGLSALGFVMLNGKFAQLHFCGKLFLGQIP